MNQEEGASHLLALRTTFMYTRTMNRRRLFISIFFIFVAAIYSGVLALAPSFRYTAVQQITIITALSAILSLLFSGLTQDYSWTDRLWSVSPVLYALIYASHQNFAPAIMVPTLLICLWGLRLTFNFARRGGYRDTEDYRWSILRERIGNPVLWMLFNILFIALYQQVLFILFTLPLNLISSASPLSPLTLFYTLAALLFLILETVADEQQYRFQQAKHGYTSRDERFEQEYEKGFRTSGLFSLSRHPAYLGEIGFWWFIYLTASSLSASYVNYTLIGPLLLTLLFIGSTRFTEGITASRYEAYREYQREVWPILPRPFNTAREATRINSSVR